MAYGKVAMTLYFLKYQVLMPHVKGGADRQCSHPPSLMDTCNDDSVIQIKYQVSKARYLLGTRFKMPSTLYQVPGTMRQVQGAGCKIPSTLYSVPGTMRWTPSGYEWQNLWSFVHANIYPSRPVLTLRAVKALVSIVCMNITYYKYHYQYYYQ